MPKAAGSTMVSVQKVSSEASAVHAAKTGCIRDTYDPLLTHVTAIARKQ